MRPREALKKAAEAFKLIEGRAGKGPCYFKLLQLTLIELDGIFVTQVEGVADQGVADGDFFQTGDVASENTGDFGGRGRGRH